MTEHEALRLAGLWIAELRIDLHLATQRAHQAEQRAARLEQHIRAQALTRRHWILAGHAKAVA